MSPRTKKRRISRKTIKSRNALAREYMYKLASLARNSQFFNWRNEYTKLIKLVGMKSQQSIPQDLKITFCRNCNSLFSLEPVPTVRVRTRSKPTPHMVVTCLKCGKIRRKNFSK